MLDGYLPILVGLLLIYLGIQNTKGNINSLHSYHRKRVKEEDRLAFGKLTGLGTIIVGISVILYNLMMLMEALLPLVAILLSVGIIAGLGLNFYAMFKYNKGIF